MDYFHLAQDAQALHKMSNLGLAYLGDAVYEVMVRSWLCLHGKLTPSRLHKAALAYVAAPRQAGPQRQPPHLSQGGHPAGVPDRHGAGGPLRLAVSARGDGAAEHTL